MKRREDQSTRDKASAKSKKDSDAKAAAAKEKKDKKKAEKAAAAKEKKAQKKADKKNSSAAAVDVQANFDEDGYYSDFHRDVPPQERPDSPAPGRK